MNNVKVHRAFASKDFKEGQLVIASEPIGDEETNVLCIQKVRQDGILDCVELQPPCRHRNPRAENMEPFWGTVIIESKP